LFVSSFVFTWKFTTNLDLSAILLSEDDLGLSQGSHIRQTIVDET